MTFNIIGIAFFRLFDLGLSALRRIYGLALSEELIDERILLKLYVAITSVLSSLIYLYLSLLLAIAAIRIGKSIVVFIRIDFLSVIFGQKILMTV